MTERPKASKVQVATFIFALIGCVFVLCDLWLAKQRYERLRAMDEAMEADRVEMRRQSEEMLADTARMAEEQQRAFTRAYRNRR
jgi:hypothetical protein